MPTFIPILFLKLCIHLDQPVRFSGSYI
ncbi:hypothetical protein NSPZN2_70235 [Nitrospira defluvii]|uniref:Uncharacterized protein n=1 Tax=Nitrospira defluvii TaxID=330214 RepID=A0ABM8SB47_9BACT|nr:hypothetical protein NSPZN2_70235 [Nitrospira defluvii]